MRPSVAIVHDYLTQRGGAERVVLAMLKAFPEAPLYTSLYLPGGTFPEFRDARLHTLPINRVRAFRENHRLALPFLAGSFSRLHVDANVVLCSSSGWAHGAVASGRKVVYCHTPARWLYQNERYIVDKPWASWVINPLRPYLMRWDRNAAGSAESYLTNSSAVRQRIREIYSIDAAVLPAPYALDPRGRQEKPDGIAPGFLLCISRLLPYKNLDAVVGAFRSLGDMRLVLVGAGPDKQRLRAAAPPNVQMLESVSDDELRWLYANSAGLIAASYEDYGLTPLEAAAFGKPVAALRWGGFVDTVREGETGMFFDRPDSNAVAGAVRTMMSTRFDPAAIRRHSDLYSQDAFIDGLRAHVAKHV